MFPSPTARAAARSLAAAALACSVAAGAADRTRLHVGITAGVAATVADDFDTDRNETGSGRPSAGLFAGARLGDLPVGAGWPVALEVGYQDISSHTIPYRIAGGTTDLTARGHSSYVALKVAAPITERVSLYGRLGASRNVVDGNTPAGQTPIDIDGRRTGLLAGFGGEFALVDNLTLRVEATTFGRASRNSRSGGISAGIAVGF
jgi:opacity protein-like surface antigen